MSARLINVEHNPETLLTTKIEPAPKDRPYAYSKFSRRTVQLAPDLRKLAGEIKTSMNFVGIHQALVNAKAKPAGRARPAGPASEILKLSWLLFAQARGLQLIFGDALNSSGSFAMFAAMRRASSNVKRWCPAAGNS